MGGLLANVTCIQHYDTKNKWTVVSHYAPEIKMYFYNSEFAILVKWLFVQFFREVAGKKQSTPNNFGPKF